MERFIRGLDLICGLLRKVVNVTPAEARTGTGQAIVQSVQNRHEVPAQAQNWIPAFAGVTE